MGGIRNLPYSQTVRVDPQDSILKGYVVWLGPHHFLYYIFLTHVTIMSSFCWVENHPYPKALGQFPLPNKLSPHPMGCNKLGNSPKKCGDTVWWPHTTYTRLPKMAEKEDPRVCYTPLTPLAQYLISCKSFAHYNFIFFRPTSTPCSRNPCLRDT